MRTALLEVASNAGKRAAGPGAGDKGVDFGQVAAFLCSDPARFITGAALQVDCEEIGSEFLFPTPHAVTDHLQGFLVIESRLPLHVEAVYTAAGADGGASIDVVRVAERRVIPRPFEPPTGVTICHYPPGNPGNAHTIVVDVASLPAHKAHGDTLGACPNP